MTRSPRTAGQVFDPIPQVIHQTWKTPDIPSEWKAWHESWQTHNPGWQHRLWTDADNRRLIAEQHPWFLPTYDAFPRDIQRVDAAKYFILYSHGGVYADLDCECLRSLSPLLAAGGAVVARSRDRVIECAFLASPPGHPLWEHAASEMQKPSWVSRALHAAPGPLGRPGVDAAHVLFRTGPHMMRRAVRRYLASGPCAGLRVLGPDVLSNRSWWRRFQPTSGSDGYVIHHYGGSWLLPHERAFVRHYTARNVGLGLAGLAGSTALLARGCG